MITKEQIVAWRHQNSARLKEIGETDDNTLKPYAVAACKDTDPDLIALRMVDEALVQAGFKAMDLLDGRWCTYYGAIYVRVFIEHLRPEAGEKVGTIQFTCVAAGFQANNDNIEVASWSVVNKAGTLELKQIQFDLAKLVLPQV